MKTLFLILILAIGAYAQQPTPTPNPNNPVTVTQGFVDDATKAFELVVVLRDALQKEQMASGASAVTKAALQAQITALNDLITIKDRKEAVYESLLILRDKAFQAYDVIVKIQGEMIQKLYDQLNKPRSGWNKFISTVGKVVVLLAGVALGRGLSVP